MKRFLLLICLPTALAACQTAEPASQPELTRIVAQPTTTRTLIQSPDPNKWVARNVKDGMVFICRPLSCPRKSAVRVIRSAAPSRSIDDEALRQYAKTVVPASVKASSLMMEANSASHETVTMKSSTTTKLRGFPAVIVEVALIGRGEPRVGFRAYLFAGNTLIDTYSISTTREVALANLHSFINAYGIVDGPTQ
ncbi:MAG: hypothetical protein O9322_15650 [Beijerinckiaceae bacterium]|nr:hypothetical protein [Beijerinckiaceae bacterium]MCZ8300784.1 hypothetical protein [Beijerinckiaceae bacterium]